MLLFVTLLGEVKENNISTSFLLPDSATMNDKVDICRYLVEVLKFDVNSISSPKLGMTPLISATSEGQINAVRYLIEKSADPNVMLICMMPQKEDLIKLHDCCYLEELLLKYHLSKGHRYILLLALERLILYRFY